MKTSSIARRNALLSVLKTPSTLRLLHREVQDVYPPYPHNGCAAFVSYVLGCCGYAVPLILGAEELCTYLKRHGWTYQHEPEAGDVFVCVDRNDNRRSDHIGFVVNPRPNWFAKNWFTCADNQSMQHGLYGRNIGPGPRTPVRGWLRFTGSDEYLKKGGEKG